MPPLGYSAVEHRVGSDAFNSGCLKEILWFDVFVPSKSHFPAASHMGGLKPLSCRSAKYKPNTAALKLVHV